MSFIHRWEPFEGAARTLVLLHGTGGDENDLIPLGRTLDPESNLLSLRGRVSEVGANRFFRRFSEGVFDQENMREETEALAGFLRSASADYGFDPEEVALAGFSNGANMAASLLFRHPEAAKAAFLMRPQPPFEPDPRPALMGVRVLIASGERDPIVPRQEAERLATIFVQSGADVEHLWLPTGHNLTRQELLHAHAWLKNPVG